MKNMITEMNLNWLEAAGASTRRNNITSMSAGAIEMNRLPAITSWAGDTPAVDVEDVPECETLTLWADSSTVGETMRSPRMPWRSALLQDSGAGAFLEKFVYLVLTATAAASLLMACWQLHSLEAGWASFVELVGRIVS